MGKILHRYLLREILAPFAFGLTVFTVVLLIARLLRLIELVVNRGVPLATIAAIFTYILPTFLEVTVPMAMLLAILVAFGRLSADSELVALRSAGLSLYQLLPAVTVVVAIATLATAALSLWGRPWGNRSLKTALYDIARTRATAGLRAQVFNDEFPGLVIYTERIDQTTDTMHHVLISDERDETQQNRIFAREALMISDPDTQTVTLRLRDGFIRTTGAVGEAEYETHFESYDVHLDLRQAFADDRVRERSPKELSLGELRETIAAKQAAGESYGPELVEYHRNFSIPFACIVFGLVAVPLGVQPVRAARSRGFALSLVVIFVYYVLLSGGQALAEQGLVPAAIGLWLPNAVLGALGLVLLHRAAREQPVAQLDRLIELLSRARDALVGRLWPEASA
jgi:lipopolysaccharide export system permease protein